MSPDISGFALLLDIVEQFPDEQIRGNIVILKVITLYGDTKDVKLEASVRR